MLFLFLFDYSVFRTTSKLVILKGLLFPINNVPSEDLSIILINANFKKTLCNWSTMIYAMMAARPTAIPELKSEESHFLGYVNANSTKTGGSDTLKPTA